ncbi:MAG TPA: TonB-dependent receptor [Vicinamibacterales bacterium]|nr:TonB-dependent receptor [Vicinamibacterales bacterium]
MQTIRGALVALAVLVLVPTTALAQASIAGIVKDASGAVLPGVTVEAASPVLIEQSRVATTDAGGRYRIVDLRAGTYTVTFSLTGFTTVKREGLALSGTFNATIDIEMKVGGVQETVTVTGESPIVDVQSIQRQTVIDNDVITSLPAARSYNSLMQLMPNTITQAGSSSDVQTVPGMVVFGGSGGRSNEGRVNIDGISVGSAFNGAGVSSYIPDIGNAREVAMIASGGLGEAETGGPSLNIVPKEGGNAFQGSAYLSGVSKGMVGSNYSTDLQNRGLTVPGDLRKIWDFTGAVGGPILHDRLWFFSTAREEGSERGVAGMFANKNAGDPTKFTYEADTTRPAVLAASYRMYTTRLTLQATSRNKFTVFWDEQKPCEGGAAADYSGNACRTSSGNLVYAGSTAPPTPSASATASPETAAYRDYGNRVNQARWTSPVSNRLLLEAGVGNYHSRWGGKEVPGANVVDLVRITEQCAVTCAANGNIPGLTYRSANWSSNVNANTQWNAALSWVTGRQNIKVGYQGALLYDNRKNFMNSTSLAYRTNNGVPDQLTETIAEFPIRQRVRSDAFYGQEQWTFGRATLQGAVRYDHAWSYFPEQTIGPVRFFPKSVTYPRTAGVTGYNDLWPRGGMAYDLFGTGKTSLKFNFGRYLEAAQNGGLFTALNPTSRISTTTSRTWTDANGNWVPDCDLLSAASQDLRGSGGDLCGASSNPNFGTEVFQSTLDPGLLSGWGVRSGDWEWGASIQQQVLPRVAVELSYQRRWLVNFTVTDNRARAPQDFTEFGIVAPSDSRLPGGGGYTLDGIYNVTPTAAARLNDNFLSLDQNYAPQKQSTNSISLNLTARPKAGVTVQGGFNTANTSSDACALQTLLPEMVTDPPSLGPPVYQPFCSTTTGWVTRFTALATYTVPKVDVLVSGTMRSDQGSPLAANWAAPTSATVNLNRPFAGIAGRTLTVNLIEPGTLYGDRVNEVDLRFAKILRFGRTRSNVGVDLLNAFNGAPVLTYLQSYSPATTTWLRPLSVLQARYVKISAQIDF